MMAVKTAHQIAVETNLVKQTAGTLVLSSVHQTAVNLVLSLAHQTVALMAQLMVTQKAPNLVHQMAVKTVLSLVHQTAVNLVLSLAQMMVESLAQLMAQMTAQLTAFVPSHPSLSAHGACWFAAFGAVSWPHIVNNCGRKVGQNLPRFVA
jgi:hypothetical protein